MSKTISKKSINELKDDNDHAKDLIKEGKFRELSRELTKITGKKQFSGWFSEDFDLDEAGLLFDYEEDRINFEYELLRFRLFVFQHLGYFDALDEDKDTKDLPDLREEGISLKTLFDKLNALREAKIISRESVAREASAEYIRICGANRSAHWRAKNNSERKLWQERVWLILCDVSEKLIQDKLSESLEVLDELEKFVFDLLVDKTPAVGEEPFLCLTTKATLLSLKAKAMHMKGDLAEAERRYYEAIEFYTKKASHPKIPKSENKAEEDKDKNINKLFQFRRTAQIYIYGLQRVNAKSGNIDRCKGNVLITELLLTDQTSDETSFQVLEFSKAVIKRIEAGTNGKNLEEAMDYVLQVKQKLEMLAHKPLLAEVNFELAILNHLLSRWNEAEVLIQEVENFYGASLFRMKANTAILRSHIERAKGNYPASLELAQSGIEFSRKSPSTIAKIDALICLAETCFSLNKAGAATESDPYKLFKDALHLNQSMKSPKVEAICLLGLCKVSSLRKEEAKAREYWNKFESIKQFCQYAFVLEHLAGLAAAEMSLLNNLFVINSHDGDFDYDKHSKRLKKWLYEKARDPGSTDEDTAKKLGISRQSVVAWKNKLGLNKKRAFRKF